MNDVKKTLPREAVATSSPEILRAVHSRHYIPTVRFARRKSSARGRAVRHDDDDASIQATVIYDSSRTRRRKRLPCYIIKIPWPRSSLSSLALLADLPLAHAVLSRVLRSDTEIIWPYQISFVRESYRQFIRVRWRCLERRSSASSRSYLAT